MEKEYLLNKSNEITLNITDGKIDSYREKDETQSTVRVYENGTIGVAGALGDPDFDALEKEATAKLGGIPYPCKLNAGIKKSIIRNKPVVAEKDSMKVGKRLAKKVADACPRFLVNGKVQTTRRQGSYKNSKGTELAFENTSFSSVFILKDKDSSNIMDASFGASVSRYGKVTEQKIVDDVKALHDTYFGEKVTLPDGKYPMIFAPTEITGQILKDFIAEMYVSGGSLFKGKLGEKIFNEKLTYAVDRNPVTNHSAAFYDAEGEIAPNYRAKIIENGVFKNVLNCKNTATMFGLPLAKTAAGAYDGVPSIGFPGSYAEPTANDVTELLGEEKAIYILITSGGDITTEGVLGLPVQLAFLVENGKFTKRLTDFTISSNVMDVLGEDFIGVTKKDVFASLEEGVMVAKMQLINN